MSSSKPRVEHVSAGGGHSVELSVELSVASGAATGGGGASGTRSATFASRGESMNRDADIAVVIRNRGPFEIGSSLSPASPASSCWVRFHAFHCRLDPRRSSIKARISSSVKASSSLAPSYSSAFLRARSRTKTSTVSMSRLSNTIFTNHLTSHPAFHIRCLKRSRSCIALISPIRIMMALCKASTKRSTSPDGPRTTRSSARSKSSVFGPSRWATSAIILGRSALMNP
jgi:hypothetical protein